MTNSSRLTTLTRIGFATRGLLYVVIAFLVIRTGRAEDTSGALQYVGDGAGKILLTVMALGLLAYGVWRLSDALFDIERHGSDRKAIMERVGAGLSGLVHLFLTWQAVRLIRGLGSGGGNGTEQGTQAALALPAGGALVMLAGAALFAIGILQLVKAVRATFLRHLEPQVAGQAWALWSGRAGYAARGLVFMICGWFFVQAGLHEQADEAGGMAEALSWLTSPADIIIAVGLFGFGLFSLIEARFRVLHDVPVDGLAARVARI